MSYHLDMIVDPETGKKTSVHQPRGKEILMSYFQVIETRGGNPSSNGPYPNKTIKWLSKYDLTNVPDRLMDIFESFVKDNTLVEWLPDDVEFGKNLFIFFTSHTGYIKPESQLEHAFKQGGDDALLRIAHITSRLVTYGITIGDVKYNYNKLPSELIPTSDYVSSDGNTLFDLIQSKPFDIKIKPTIREPPKVPDTNNLEETKSYMLAKSLDYLDG